MGLRPGLKIAVFGQPVLDRFVYGVTHRISREAPVLIVRQEREEVFLGGAANTAANLAGLGTNAHLCGLVGQDQEQLQLRTEAQKAGIDTSALVEDEALSTVTKTRILAGGLHTTRQQMLRIDREFEFALSGASRRTFLNSARELIGSLDAAIISDYGHHSLTDIYLEVLGWLKDESIPVVVDSRHAMMRYRGASCVTPNEPEAEIALNRSIRSAEDAEEAATTICAELDLEAVLLTRGKYGMVLVSGGQAHHIPAEGGEAVDVTGAGDTVAATFTAAVASGLPRLEAAQLANRAASIVVQSTGTVAIQREQLL